MSILKYTFVAPLGWGWEGFVKGCLYRNGDSDIPAPDQVPSGWPGKGREASSLLLQEGVGGRGTSVRNHGGKLSAHFKSPGSESTC